jgi:hypothetical protein
MTLDYREPATVSRAELNALREVAEAAGKVRLSCIHLSHASTITLCEEELLRRALARLDAARKAVA